MKLIQLPDDAKLSCYKQTRPFHFDAVYESATAEFKGTEQEFLQAGKAYAYVQIDKFTRVVVG